MKDAKNVTMEDSGNERVVTCDRDDSVMLFYSYDVETGARVLAVAVVR